MKQLKLLQVGALHKTPLVADEYCRTIVVQSEGEKPESVTLIGYDAEDFPYKPGALLLLHTIEMNGVCYVYKMFCIGYDLNYPNP